MQRTWIENRITAVKEFRFCNNLVFDIDKQNQASAMVSRLKVTKVTVFVKDLLDSVAFLVLNVILNDALFLIWLNKVRKPVLSWVRQLCNLVAAIPPGSRSAFKGCFLP
jgi:hypothetical protein